MLYDKHYCRRKFYIGQDAAFAESFIKSLPESFGKTGKTIHKARNEIKIYDCAGIKVNVKKYCIPPIGNRILYSFGFRAPKAKRAYLNALEIRKRGFNTPKPFGYIIERGLFLIKHSYFISEQIEDMVPVGHGCKNEALAKSLAKYAADMHKAGLLHRDFTPGNILYSEDNGKYSFMMVDINRFIFKNKRIKNSAAIRSLIRPFGDKKTLKLFAAEYSKYRGLDEDKLVCVVSFLQRLRKRYDEFKRALKKIPPVKYIYKKRGI